jgi:L-fuconolactonase
MESTRREWLLQSAVFAIGMPLAASKAQAADKRSAIIDAHIHFYDPTRPEGVPWPAKKDTVLYRPVLPAEWKKIATPLGVTGSVVVEASPWLEDNHWLCELADKTPEIRALIGNLVLGDKAFPDQWKRFRNNKNFVGMRLNEKSLKESASCKECWENLGLIQKDKPVLEFLAGTAALSGISSWAKEFPETAFIVDHLGLPTITAGEPPREWLKLLDDLAGLKNVWVKWSGYVEKATPQQGKTPTAVDFYAKVFAALWHRPGPARLIWGSNWPVSSRFADYATVLKIARDFAANQPVESQNAVFAGNAQSVYRIARE